MAYRLSCELSDHKPWDGKSWKSNVMQNEFEVLLVSQFTLYAKLKGTKPDFHFAMGGPEAEKMYNECLRQLGDAYSPDKIQGGKFGAKMDVHIRNDGPVTMMFEFDIDTVDKKHLKKLNNQVKKIK